MLAEGTPSESYVDHDNRDPFQNAPPVGLAPPPGADYCASRAIDGFQLERIRRRLATVAATLQVDPAA